MKRPYSNARDDCCDVPRVHEDAVNSEAVDKSIGAYEIKMTSLIENKPFCSPLNEIPHAKNAVTAKKLSLT